MHQCCSSPWRGATHKHSFVIEGSAKILHGESSQDHNGAQTAVTFSSPVGFTITPTPLTMSDDTDTTPSPSPSTSDASFSTKQEQPQSDEVNRRSSIMQKNLRRALTGDENKRVIDHAKLNLQKTSHVVKKRVRKVVTGSSETRLRDWAKEAKVVKTVDKFSFVLGVTVLCTTEFMLLQHPQHFGMYYVVLITIMMALRLYMYAKNKWLYFLLDFCYASNASCFISVLYAPDNQALWRLNYSVTNGVLLGAILAWRNSLVFHSLDKVTSIAIHLLPGLLTYLERWNENGRMCSKAEKDTCRIGIQGALLEPLLFYMCWQCLYILKTEVMDRKIMLANPNIQTSMRWLTRDSKNPMHKIAKKVCRNIGVLSPEEDFDPESLKTKCVFWTGNFIFIIITLLPIPILFANVKANTLYMLFVISAAVYNGSNYYFEVFASRYIQKLEDKQKEIRSTEGETVVVVEEQDKNGISDGGTVEVSVKEEWRSIVWRYESMTRNNCTYDGRE